MRGSCIEISLTWNLDLGQVDVLMARWFLLVKNRNVLAQRKSEWFGHFFCQKRWVISTMNQLWQKCRFQKFTICACILLFFSGTLRVSWIVMQVLPIFKCVEGMRKQHLTWFYSRRFFIFFFEMIFVVNQEVHFVWSGFCNRNVRFTHFWCNMTHFGILS